MYVYFYYSGVYFRLITPETLNRRTNDDLVDGADVATPCCFCQIPFSLFALAYLMCQYVCVCV